MPSAIAALQPIKACRSQCRRRCRARADADPCRRKPAITAEVQHTLELIVARNDTLDALFRRNGLSISDLAACSISRLPPSRCADSFRATGSASSTRARRSSDWSVSCSDDALLAITREPTGFTATEIPREIEIRVVGRHGVVNSSLFEAGMAAEIPDAVIMRMAGIFQWDIDFILDVRAE